MKMQEISHHLVELAVKQGAVDADALAVGGMSESITVRHGKLESIEREDSCGIGLRAFVETKHGLSFASTSTSDLSAEGQQKLVQQVLAMAAISEADPDAMPPKGALHPSEEELAAWAKSHPLHASWTHVEAKQAALECEATALDYSKEISNSEGATAGFGHSLVAYASADGFCGTYERGSMGLSVSVIAGVGAAMQRDYAYSRAAGLDGIRPATEVGEEAARRATSRLNPTGIKSRTATVIFEPRVAISLIGHLTSAINGRSVLQKRSFLAEAAGERIFPEWIQIVEDPDHAKGLGNRLFDGEGTRCGKRNIIENGILSGFLADRYAAKRLGIAPTGNASRGLTGDISIGTSNVILQPGALSQPELLKEIGNGVLITELMGFGVNGVTGDYSRGAAGFLIENGEIVRPVAEITTAGNLKKMFADIAAIGNDLTWFGSTAVPSIAIGDMTIAGQD